MAITVASLQAILDLDKRKFEKGLKAADKSLGSAGGTLKDFTSQTDKLGDALAQATNRGRLGLSEIDQGAANAKGSLSSMLSSLSGGAATQAESTLGAVADNVGKLGKAAVASGNKFEGATRDMGSGMDRLKAKMKDFGDDSEKAIGDVVDELRKVSQAADEAGDAGDEAGGKFGGLADGLADAIPGLDKLKGFAAGGPLAIIAGAAIAAGTAIVGAGAESQRIFGLIEARTGATGDELQDLGQTARDVFRRGWGESAEDAASAVIQVKQVLGETGEAAENSAVRALVLRDVFGTDIPESLRAVRSATAQFGGESQKTFDLITTLTQRVGDPYQDLADTINEYSADLAQAGFTQEEFFGILEAGVTAGARNFDVLADLIRETTIRLADGSDKTKDALNRLFEATGKGGAEFFKLGEELDLTTGLIEANERALKRAEGAYEAQAEIVGDLESALSDARRELDELSRPNLKGMEEFDDKLFELDQNSKRLQLALLDLEEDTPAFEDTKKQLEEINKEIDRVGLERDLTIGTQLREIEKLAREGVEPIVSYEEALANVASKKDEISELEGVYNDQLAALDPLADRVSEYEGIIANLTNKQNDLKESMADLVSPAEEFLEAIANSEMTTKEAISSIIQMLGQVENQVIADQIGVDLMGSKFEELGVDIVTALDPAVNRMTDFEGATDRAAEAVSQGLGPAWKSFWRGLKLDVTESFESLTKLNEERGTSSGLGRLLGFGGARRPPADDVSGGDAIPSFAGGGTVPGPVGAPVIIRAHGGEQVTPVGESGGVTVIVQGSINGDQHLQEVVMQSFGQLSQALSRGVR